MGKRKSRKAPPKRVGNKKLSTQFNCPFCNHEKSVDVKLSKDHTALLKCSKCGESYETQSNYLSEPIDIFAEWLDEIAAVNEREKNKEAAPAEEDDE